MFRWVFQLGFAFVLEKEIYFKSESISSIFQ